MDRKTEDKFSEEEKETNTSEKDGESLISIRRVVWPCLLGHLSGLYWIEFLEVENLKVLTIIYWHFLVIVILTAVIWNLKVVLTNNPLIAETVALSEKYLLVICVSSSENCLFMSFIHLLIDSFGCLYNINKCNIYLPSNWSTVVRGFLFVLL